METTSYCFCMHYNSMVECHFIKVAIHQKVFSLNAQAHLIFKTVSRIFLGILDQKLYKHSNTSLTTDLSEANPACQEPPILDRQG
jgi:hypothetical protein